MRIYVLGSSWFKEEMVATTDRLKELGYNAWIHPDYEAFVRGEKQDIVERWHKGERAAIKRENKYLEQHYQGILESDIVLFVNSEKKGVKNYIGGNVLIEMGQAYVHGKRIFFLHGMPRGLPYMDEIESMDPICLEGNLENLEKHGVNKTTTHTATRPRLEPKAGLKKVKFYRFETY